MVELKGYKVNKLEIENKAQAGTQLKLQNQLKYNVNYMDGNKQCIGMLDLRITDADMKPFEIKIEMVAQFTYDDDDQKAGIHTASFDQLFPFVRQIVCTAASFTGMPGLLIPIMKLNKDSVRVASPQNNSDDDNESSPLN